MSMSFPWGSPEYENYIEHVHRSSSIRNRRNRYTIDIKKGKPNPFGELIPVVPTSEDLRITEREAQLRRSLKGHTDSWWFRRIDKAVKDPFYRSKVAALIWWEYCNSEHQLTKSLWHQRMDQGYDFDRDLFADHDVIEKALYEIGFPPARARDIVHPSNCRKRWKAQLLNRYRCKSCGWTATGCSYPPRRCPECKCKNTVFKTKRK